VSRVVVKIGTSSLTDEDGVIDSGVIEKVAEEVAALRSRGHEVTIVTSGAIAAGLPVLGIAANDRPTDAVTLQAMSSIGQPALLHTWSIVPNTFTHAQLSTACTSSVSFH